ncbi:hypothetical protein PFISCL1PPCAC_1661, partial [Pristionchus fissidentatus]
SVNMCERLFVVNNSRGNFVVSRFDDDTNKMIMLNFRLPDCGGNLQYSKAIVCGSKVYLFTQILRYYLDSILVIETNPTLADWAAKSLRQYKNGKKIMRTYLPREL